MGSSGGGFSSAGTSKGFVKLDIIVLAKGDKATVSINGSFN